MELYERTVPDAVREFLDRKTPTLSKPRRPARPSTEKSSEGTPRSEGQTVFEKDGDVT